MATSSWGVSSITSARARRPGGWKDVADDIRELAQALDAAPDVCACGDAAGHLDGLCPCCGNHGARTTCRSCGTILRELDAKFESLLEDRLRFLPAVQELVEPEAADRVHQLSKATDRCIRTFQRLQTAVDEFRRGCSTTHLRTLRGLAHELSAAARSVEEAL